MHYSINNHYLIHLLLTLSLTDFLYLSPSFIWMKIFTRKKSNKHAICNLIVLFVSTFPLLWHICKPNHMLFFHHSHYQVIHTNQLGVNISFSSPLIELKNVIMTLKVSWFFFMFLKFLIVCWCTYCKENRLHLYSIVYKQLQTFPSMYVFFIIVK